MLCERCATPDFVGDISSAVLSTDSRLPRVSLLSLDCRSPLPFSSTSSRRANRLTRARGRMAVTRARGGLVVVVGGIPLGDVGRREAGKKTTASMQAHLGAGEETNTACTSIL